MTKDIVTDLDFVKDLLNSGKSGFVQLFLIKYNTKKELVIYKPIVEYPSQKEFLNMFINFFKNENRRNKNQVDFEILHGDNDTYSLLDIKSFNRINNLVTTIKTGSGFLDDLTNLTLHTLSGYAVKIFSEDSKKEIIYFSSVDGYKNIKKGMGLIANVTNNKVTKIDPKDYLGFNPTIGSYISDNNEMLIIKKSIFENVFKMREAYKEAAKPVLDFVKGFNSIENFDEFYNDTINNANLSRRVALLDNRKVRVKKLLNNIPKVKEALQIEEYKSEFENIKVTDTHIVYDKAYKDSFITLISDSAVESFITEEKFINN